MSNLAISRLLTPVIELDALDSRRQPLLSLAGNGGSPGASLSSDINTFKRWPFPIISSLTMMQFWTLAAWQKSRIDVSASCDLNRRSSVGVCLVVCPDSDTRFRFGFVNSDRLSLDAYAEKQVQGHTFGVGLRPDDASICRPAVSWTGVLVPKSTTARLDVTLGPDGPRHAWSVLSTPQGPDGFRLRFAMDGTATRTPVPLLAVSQPIAAGQRLFLRLKPHSVEAGIAVEPREGLAISIGLLSSAGQGLAVSFRFQYWLFTASLPIWIHSDPKDLHSAVICIVVPTTLWGLWNSLPLLTARRQRLHHERRISAHRTLSLKIENLRTRRQSALEQQEAMRPEAEARRRAEAGKDGLVIEMATFYIDNVDGRKASRAQARGPEFSHEFDVTIPLQFWVEDSKLVVAATPKRSMLGFYCPFAPGVEKASPMLRLRYRYQGASYTCTVSECEPLRLPDPRHSKV